jgi:hypothetical protein
MTVILVLNATNKSKAHKLYGINERAGYNMPGHQTTNNLHILSFPCIGNRTGNSWASSHAKTNGLSDSPSGNLMRYSSWGRQSTMFTYPRRQLVGYCDGKCSLLPVKKELI